MMNKIKRNIFSQSFCQIVNTVIPFLISPYLTRVLGAENLGIYSYRLSLVSYFTLIAMQGMLNYGTKKIAENSKDSETQERMFYHLAFIQCVIAAIVTVVYVIFAFFVFDRDIISLIMCLNIICCMFDFHWLLYGKEDFHITTVVNLIVRLMYVISIFLFVKTPNDLNYYVIIMSLTTVVTNLLLLGVIGKKIRLRKFSLPSFKEAKKHIWENFVLFVPIAAQTVYHVMDKTMLGILSSYEQTGYYYNADKLISIPVSLIACVCVVLMPRITALLSSNDNDKKALVRHTTMQAIVCLSSAFCFGIIAVAEDFVPLYFGSGFLECIPIVRMLSVVIILKSVSEGLKTQYLIPQNNNACIISSVSIGCLLNLFINMLLIPKMGAKGAVIGTIAAELIAVFVQILFVCVKEKNYKNVFYGAGFIIIGLLMSKTIEIFDRVCDIESLFISLLVKVAIGVIFFTSFTLVYCHLTKDYEFSKKILVFLHSKERKSKSNEYRN